MSGCGLAWCGIFVSMRSLGNWLLKVGIVYSDLHLFRASYGFLPHFSFSLRTYSSVAGGGSARAGSGSAPASPCIEASGCRWERCGRVGITLRNFFIMGILLSAGKWTPGAAGYFHWAKISPRKNPSPTRCSRESSSAPGGSPAAGPRVRIRSPAGTPLC